MATRLSLNALGTHWWIESEYHFSKEDLRKQIAEFERRYSRFNPDSQLSALNRDKFFRSPSPELRELVLYGLRMYSATEGIFNMSVGAQLERDGYGGGADPLAHISTTLENDVTVMDEIINLASWVRLDFGGFGKGWLIDSLGKYFATQGIASYLINGGGDILAGDRSQEILIEHPLDEDQCMGSVTIQNGAVASSSDRKRRWKTADGTIKAHIIDPSCGSNSVQRPLSVHVRAGTALTADTFATVFLIVSEEKRRQLADRFHLEYMVVTSDLRYSQTAGFNFKTNS